jgi:uncharacterized SAM-binding protein YcdF (DUF218 family)
MTPERSRNLPPTREMPVVIIRPVPRRRWWRWLAVAFLVLTLAVGGLTYRLFVRPELPPLPDRADVIFVLSGYGDRIHIAERLVREGRAPVVVWSTTAERAAAPCLSGLAHEVTVMCIHPEPYSTRGEARAIATLAAEHGWRSMILVTTRDQAWRARVRVSRCFDGEIYHAIAELPRDMWPRQVAYQWGATIKAFTVEIPC